VIVYKILPRSQWEAASEAGQFTGSPVDLADGFIHFSTADQLAGTLAKHFAGQSDLLVLHVDTERLDEICPGKLKFEVSRGGEEFPHLYSDLPLQAVQHVAPVAAE